MAQGTLVPNAVGTEAERLAAQGNFRGAIAVYEQFLREFPDSAHGLNNAAGFSLELGDGQKAKDFLERALRIDPGYEAALCNLAEAKRMLKDLLGTREAFEQALRVCPKSVSARMGLGRMFLELKNGEMACRYCGEVAQLEPSNPAAWGNLGWAKLLVGDVEAAEQAFKRAISIDPQSEHGRQGLARVQMMRQMSASARRTGATITTSDGTVVSGANRKLVCDACGHTYVEHGQIRMGARSFGGALCRRCGKFFCEPCVARKIHSGTAAMLCPCKNAQATMGEDGYVKLKGFEELVVFPSG